MSQLGGLEPAAEALRRAVRHLAVEQQGQPFGVAEVAGGVLLLQFDEGLGHAVELEGSQLVECRVV